MEDAADMGDWIGRSEEATDILTPELVRRFRALTDDPVENPEPGAPAPLAIHWCFLFPALPMGALGPDGHGLSGLAAPPPALPRRMWAGGELEFLQPLRIGETLTRRSIIAEVVSKQGKSGSLCFVTLRHEIRGEGGVAIRERQEIVYQGRKAKRPAVAEVAPTAPEADASRTVALSPVLLFRYSAVTYNGHRIHYDRDYCLKEENYPGLVVHGPLQATFMLQLAAELGGGPPRRFRFRNRAPIFDGGAMSVKAKRDGGRIRVWTEDQEGNEACVGEAEF